MKLIDADKAMGGPISKQMVLDEIDKMPTVTDANGAKYIEKTCLRIRINTLPPMDTVLVQRCDGCRYADWHSNGCIAYCTKHEVDGFVADDYCSYGKKDGDHGNTD